MQRIGITTLIIDILARNPQTFMWYVNPKLDEGIVSVEETGSFESQYGTVEFEFLIYLQGRYQDRKILYRRI